MNITDAIGRPSCRGLGSSFEAFRPASGRHRTLQSLPGFGQVASALNHQQPASSRRVHVPFEQRKARLLWNLQILEQQRCAKLTLEK
ncbi:hypothetical protein OKW29_000583 [Paraburkholderia sp. CI3]